MGKIEKLDWEGWIVVIGCGCIGVFDDKLWVL